LQRISNQKENPRKFHLRSHRGGIVARPGKRKYPDDRPGKSKASEIGRRSHLQLAIGGREERARNNSTLATLPGRYIMAYPRGASPGQRDTAVERKGDEGKKGEIFLTAKHDANISCWAKRIGGCGRETLKYKTHLLERK